MRSITDPFKEKVAEIISAEIKSTFEKEIPAEILMNDLAPVPNIKMGHLSFPCFRFAKDLKRKPPEIAKELQEKWSYDGMCTEIKAVGPFLNFFFKPEFFATTVTESMISGEYFKVSAVEEKPYLIEYSQPNTHKELHVGHMRNLCYGHSLVLLFKYCGNKVVSCTFPGDSGTHVAKCLWFLKYHNQESVPETGRGEWLGKMYTAGNNKLEDELGTDKEDENRKQLTEILKQLEQESGEYYDQWKETREWSIELMQSVYDWAGVKFDKWFWESEVDSSSVKLVKDLHAEGKLIEDQGAIGMNLEEEKLGFCLLLKSDGNGLYATKDLDLMRLKFSEYDPVKNIYIVDVRQELHFKQVMTVYEKLGYGSKERSLHLKYNFVELPDGAMSSRKGNVVPLKELIERMRETVETEHLSRYAGEWSADEIKETADVVAQGAIKYGMNRMDSNKKIIFDMKEWLRLDGESGPYIQYAHARICSILRKQDVDIDKGIAGLGSVDWSLLIHESELSLMLQLSQFQWSMFKALEGYKTSSICSYVYELSKVFNTFYHDSPIAQAENEELKKARLALVMAAKAALAQGLGLLGIVAPEKM